MRWCLRFWRLPEKLQLERLRRVSHLLVERRASRPTGMGEDTRPSISPTFCDQIVFAAFKIAAK
jgi:hypothetical protein